MRAFDSCAVSLAFPLGGIGTGNVSLGARGELRDWEIFNHAGKGTRLPNTFFALWARLAGQAPVVRLLEGPLQPPHDLSHGYHPNAAAGLPRCAGTRFHGEYPFAFIEWIEPALPVAVALEAYTPLIPLNPDDSGLPCAVLSYHPRPTRPITPVDVTLVGSLCNPIGGVAFDAFGNLAAPAWAITSTPSATRPAARACSCRRSSSPPTTCAHGSLALVTTHAARHGQAAWLRGQWFDDLQEFWDDLSADGRLTALGYDTPRPPAAPTPARWAPLEQLAPGQSRAVTVLAHLVFSQSHQ